MHVEAQQNLMQLCTPLLIKKKKKRKKNLADIFLSPQWQFIFNLQHKEIVVICFPLQAKIMLSEKIKKAIMNTTFKKVSSVHIRLFNLITTLNVVVTDLE